MVKIDPSLVRSVLAAVIQERLDAGRFALADTPDAVMMQSSSPSGKVRIFVSYCWADRPAARKLCLRLVACGYDVWYDERTLLPGQNWEQEIHHAVTSSNVFVAVLSQNSSNAKGFVQKEQGLAIEVARDRRADEIFIIPLQIDTAPIPPKFEKWHALSLRQDDWFNRLVRSINSHFQ